MQSRDVLLAIGLIISLPILVASLGASAPAGLVIGAVLIVVGIAWWIRG